MHKWVGAAAVSLAFGARPAESEALGAIERRSEIRVVRATRQDGPPEQLELGGEKPVTPAK